MMKNLKKKKGFTLIELIIVIAILGIIAAIAVPRFAGTRQNAQQGADEANAKTIYNATVLLVEQGTIGRNAGEIEVVSTDTEGAQIIGQLGDTGAPTLQSRTGNFFVRVSGGTVTIWNGPSTGSNVGTQIFP